MIDIVKYLETENLILNNREVPGAEPIIITEKIPFSNNTYDFSRILGEYNYNRRTITLEYTCNSNLLGQIHNIYSNVSTKLLYSPDVKIKFDDIRGYFIGDVVNFSTIDDLNYCGIFKITISCYPFRFDDELFGEDIWDSFNFEIDYVENKQFNITGTTTIVINNTGVTIVPVVQCSSSMTLSLNGYTANFIAGDNKDIRFKLKNGRNEINVVGNGTVKFNFRKEFL